MRIIFVAHGVGRGYERKKESKPLNSIASLGFRLGTSPGATNMASASPIRAKGGLEQPADLN
ncbi:MAG: hypothetical protein R2747_02240 [Pyrinomonadaceae bacterium]